MDPGYIKPCAGIFGLDLLCVVVRIEKMSSSEVGARDWVSVVGRTGIVPKRELLLDGGVKCDRGASGGIGVMPGVVQVLLEVVFAA
jgi:hypothetical protein